MKYLSTKLGSSPVIVKGLFAVSKAAVFEAWTDENEIIQWFGASPNSMQRAEIDLKVGGLWRFIFEETDEKTVSLEGEYLEIVDNEKLVFSWKHVVRNQKGELTQTESSRVTVSFDEGVGGTKVTLIHENINAETGRLGVGKGWENTFKSFQNIIVKTNN